MRCRLCNEQLRYIHGHGACVRAGCPLYGANQAECCDGEMVAQCPVPTSQLASVGAPSAPKPPEESPSDAFSLLIDGDPVLSDLLAEAERRLATDDPGHDVHHAKRVAVWTQRLGAGELAARMCVPAALFHDLVNLPKDHPQRKRASTLSAEAAEPILERHGYSSAERQVIAQAIIDHSFSRGAVPQSELGRALQDADRLEALGVLGVFRTISTGVRLGAQYFDAGDPWARRRPLDDKAFSLDHFFTKLLGLADTMCTPLGRKEAQRRTRVMLVMLGALGEELGEPWRGGVQ